MAEDIFTFLFTGVEAVFTWFDDVVNSTGMMPYVLGIIILFIFFRLIIAPLFGANLAGGMGSDSVSRNSDADSVGSWRPAAQPDYVEVVEVPGSPALGSGSSIVGK